MRLRNILYDDNIMIMNRKKGHEYSMISLCQTNFPLKIEKMIFKIKYWKNKCNIHSFSKCIFIFT